VAKARGLTVCALTVLCLALLAPAPAMAGRSDGAQMVRQLNKVRSKHHLPPFRTSGKLQRSSSRFATWLQRHDTFAHRGRVHASGFRRLGEALGLHAGRGLGVRGTVRHWLRSPTHRALVLSGSMRYVGASAAPGRFRGGRATIWVLHLGGKH